MMASRSAVTMRMETVLLASIPMNGYRSSDMLLFVSNKILIFITEQLFGDNKY